MTFAEKMQEIIDSGLTASKNLVGLAGDKAKELGTMGVLKFEIAELQSRAEKLIAKLGNEVYVLMVVGDAASVSRDAPALKEILSQISDVRLKIESKEKELAAIGGKEPA